MGLGASQISTGLEYVGIANSTLMGTFWIIIFITILGLISVVLGLNAGIKRLSQFNMILCGLFLITIFLSGPTGFILDGFVENIGTYLQNFISLSANVNAYRETELSLIHI